MSRYTDIKTQEKELRILKPLTMNVYGFEKYSNRTGIFKTKFADDFEHNDERVDVLAFVKGKDKLNDRYVVRFQDGTVDDNIYTYEITEQLEIEKTQDEEFYKNIIQKWYSSYNNRYAIEYEGKIYVTILDNYKSEKEIIKELKQNNVIKPYLFEFNSYSEIVDKYFINDIKDDIFETACCSRYEGVNESEYCLSYNEMLSIGIDKSFLDNFIYRGEHERIEITRYMIDVYIESRSEYDRDYEGYDMLIGTYEFSTEEEALEALEELEAKDKALEEKAILEGDFEYRRSQYSYYTERDFVEKGHDEQEKEEEYGR